MSNALTLPVASSDSLDQYMRTIRSFPVLSADEEFDLATRLKKDNDLDAARQLIVSHLRLVASIARGYAGSGAVLLYAASQRGQRAAATLWPPGKN